MLLNFVTPIEDFFTIIVLVAIDVSRVNVSKLKSFFGLIFFNQIEFLTQKEFLWILLMAFFGNLSQLFYFQALKYKDVSFVTPFEYLRFVLIAFFAILFFNEIPYLATYLGSLIIFSGMILLSLDKKIIAKSYNFIFKN